ncbi:MAG TPA: TolC family protein, partial [Phycisphaerae bacterium]|nr:TolC family protein [Phycisphaerae bacterium]
MHSGMTRLSELSVLGLVLLAGCQWPGTNNEPMDQWIRSNPDAWQVSEGGATHYSHTLASESPAATPQAPPIGPEWGAKDYVRMALERNPAIRSAQRKVDRLLARVPQARSLDDPMLMVAPLGEMAETAAGQVGTMTGISQKFPLPAKLDARGQIAYQEAAMAMQELASVRLGVMADTRRAYWAYYFATRAIETTNASRNLLSQFRQIAEAKYIAGVAVQQDVLRASVEL